MLLRATRVVDLWQGKRKTLFEPSELFPGHFAFTVAAIEPLTPGSTHLVAKVVQHSTVAGYAVIGVMAADLLTQLLPLLVYRQVPVFTTPLVDRPDRPSQPFRHRFLLHHPVALA